MRYGAYLSRRNVATLQQLQGHLSALAATMSELVAVNQRAAALDETEAAASAPNSLTEKRSIVSKDILAYLRLAGSAGQTTAELVDLASQKGGTVPNTVRTTLARFRKNGIAEKREGRWRLVAAPALAATPTELGRPAKRETSDAP